MSSSLHVWIRADIQFEAESDRLKLDFEQHGEIQSWFDMIKRRGMVFVTYVRPPLSYGITPLPLRSPGVGL